LGAFFGATSDAAFSGNALPRWIVWLGMVAGTVSILSLASLLVFPAKVLIPVGRLLAWIWSIAVGIRLVLGKQRQSGAAGERRVLA
jgi:hypothetical protein